MGVILLNPGSYKLPQPNSSNTRYTYFGYLIAESEKDAQDVFKGKEATFRLNNSVDDLNRKMIAQTGYLNIADKDDKIIIENIEGDWLKTCHVSQSPIEKQDIIFKTLKGSKLAENHIIICGMAENIRHLVMPLRAKHLNDPSPIVILHDQIFSAKIWQQLCYFT